MRFEFIVKLFVWEDFLQQVKSLSDYLQSSKLDLLHGAELILTTMKALQEWRSEEWFRNLLGKNRNSATEVGIDPSFKKPRFRHKKVMPGEVCIGMKL